MKKLITVFAASLGFVSCDKNRNADCIDPGLVNREVACTMHHDPVCGCDGNTYSNACVAKYQHGVKESTKGICSCDYSSIGTIVDITGLDGCEMVIEMQNGEKLEPLSWPKSFTPEAGTTVEFDYIPVDAGSICMVGQTVQVTCIRELVLFPHSDDHART